MENIKTPVEIIIDLLKEYERDALVLESRHAYKIMRMKIELLNLLELEKKLIKNENTDKN